MVAYNFQKQFIGAIEDRAKMQTVRADRKNGHAQPGQTLQLYYGMRTKQCRLIARAVCLANYHVEIDEEQTTVDFSWKFENDYFASLDGFDSGDQMLVWFKNNHTLPFTGRLIIWHFALPPLTSGERLTSEFLDNSKEKLL